jgi:hypothetical protein
MLWFIWPSDFRGKDFLEINQSETRIACGGQWPFLLTDQNEMSNLQRGPSIHASYQVSIHLAKRFQRRRFLRNSSENAWPNEPKCGRKHLWKILYEGC